LHSAVLVGSLVCFAGSVGHTLLQALWLKKHRQRGIRFKFSGSSLAAIKLIFSGDITERLSV
ncbi:hypothetical protein, partial [uncultured Photobacterium sp.]|uniref:hypothetical protein n=1 Tax=uncultured Photobacterium sp. TaxID=173973 RepID=UPI002629D7B9